MIPTIWKILIIASLTAGGLALIGVFCLSREVENILYDLYRRKLR